ncbi:MAG TPA: anti-sigma factor [Gemmatimonadaceae bacterium]|nr:anti-sigma factor [Gemmatimonadaceae bacterium]
MTDCEETRERLSAYVDGELPPDEAAAVAEHLTSCAACAREYDAVLQTVRTLREGLVRHRAPDVLRARVRAALRDEPPSATTASAPVARGRSWTRWRAPVAAALAIAVASSGLTMLAARDDHPSAAPTVAEEVLASHIRSLMPEHLTDVRSTDQHNVKPWFNGRLDFSPAVARLDDAGFPLLGGRVDYVHGRPVAVVVYGRRQHVINVFSWPADSEHDAPAPAPESRHGYNMLRWRSGGVEYWVASDLNAAELRQFASLLRRPDSTAAGSP